MTYDFDDFENIFDSFLDSGMLLDAIDCERVTGGKLVP